MAGVVTTLIAHDNIEALGQQIDDLAFAFIAPLGADDCDNHFLEIGGCWCVTGAGTLNNCVVALTPTLSQKGGGDKSNIRHKTGAARSRNKHSRARNFLSLRSGG